MSPTVLNERLKALRESGLVAQAGNEGYGLTPLGRELIDVFMPLVEWSKRWARRSGRGRGQVMSGLLLLSALNEGSGI